MAEENRCPQCGDKLAANAPRGVCPKCLIKLGLPSNADVGKNTTQEEQSGVPTIATPPGRFLPPEPAELAKQFPQLEILALLGQGGMGAVYKALQKRLDRLVALKILPPEVGRDPAFAERFTREARSMAKLSHQHVVTLHEFGQTEEGLYYFIMEFVDGTDLRHVIQTGELRPDEALVIVPKICEALHYAHNKGIVHRDIKPENILLDKEGNIKIADFGLARLLDRPGTGFTLTQAGQRMGTPHYMAPEQIEGAHEVDHRADIYSLGVVFYEMLTGQLPIGQFAPPSQKVQVDVRLDKVVLKSLAHEPERRYQHASEVKIDVETIAGQERAIIRPLEHPGEEAIRKQVKRPAIGLLATGIVNWIGTSVVMLTLGYLELVPQELLWMMGPGILILSGFIFFAALKMMRLEAYPWTITGSILAMITTPGNIIGLPIGVWALVVLTSGEVKAAFARKKTVAESKTSKPEGKPAQRRFSRTAIVGACCSALALFWIPAALIYVGEIHKSDLQEFIMWFCILIGSTPVFATTILGIVSITQIRHSSGRLYGMGLALFDAVLFPLLALNLAIFGFLTIACQSPAAELPLGAKELALLVSLPVCIVLNIFIIRWTWRKANGGLEPVQILTGEIPQPVAIPPTQPTVKLHQPGWQGSEIKTDVETIAGQERAIIRPLKYADTEAIREQVKHIAIGLLIVGVVGLLSFAARELCMTWMINRTFSSTSPIWLLVQFLDLVGGLDLFKGLFLIAAALPILWMRGYRLAVATSIVAMLPVGPSFLAGLPIGIWALSILSKPEVRTAFPQNRRSEKTTAQNCVQGPAKGLMVVGILNWLCMLLWVVFTLMVRAAIRQIELVDPPTGGYMPWVSVLVHMSPVTIALIALIMAGAGVFLIFAAIRMKRLQFEAGAIAAGILAMLIPPANLLGLPIGIWVLSVLSRPEVKTAFVGKKKGVKKESSESEAKTLQRRFSRAAIVGACCVPLAILLLVPPLVLTDPKPLRSSEYFTMMRETTGGFVLVILFALVGLAGPFVTTILGMVSIGHIRQSAGRVYGMGLALFDALLFPLLALNIAIPVVFVLAGMGPPESLILALIICGPLNIFLIRRAWRKANFGLETAQGDQLAGTR